MELIRPSLLPGSSSRRHPRERIHLSREALVESIVPAPAAKLPVSPVFKEKILRAREHHKAVRAEADFTHTLDVLATAARANLLNPLAPESDRFSLDLADLILYHSLSSKAALPRSFDQSLLSAFLLQERLMVLDSTVDDGARYREYISILNDPGNDLTILWKAVKCRIADLMTTCNPATQMAALSDPSFSELIGSDYRNALIARADPMLRIYCPMADWGGLTAAYRRLRDNAIYYYNPEGFMEVAREVSKRMDAVANTTRMMYATFDGISRKMGLRVLVATDYQTAAQAFPEIGSDTVVIAARPFKGPGGLYAKMRQKDIPLEKIHDWSGATVITATKEQMYLIAEYLASEGLHEAAKGAGAPDIHIQGPVDYVANPKPGTNYQSLHIDGITSNPIIVNGEWILRTLPMHLEADEGDSSHDNYKKSLLQNGERARLKRRLAEIRAGLAG